MRRIVILFALVFSITAVAQENETMIVRLAEIEVYPQHLKEYLESLSAALEDRPLPKIQAGHAPHGERPEATHDETTRSRDDETDIQKAEIIWTT